MAIEFFIQPTQDTSFCRAKCFEPAIDQELVAATRKKFLDRKTPWTQAELDAWKDDAAGAVPAPAPAAPAPAK